MSKPKGFSTGLGFIETDGTAFALTKDEKGVLKDGENETTVDNAINAILNSDGTYSGFTKSSDNILKAGDKITPTEIILWANPDGYGNKYAEGIELSNIFEGDILEIYFKGRNFSNLKFKVGECGAGNYFYNIIPLFQRGGYTTGTSGKWYELKICELGVYIPSGDKTTGEVKIGFYSTQQVNIGFEGTSNTMEYNHRESAVLEENCPKIVEIRKILC